MSKYLLFFHPSCDPVDREAVLQRRVGDVASALDANFWSVHSAIQELEFLSKALLGLPDEFLARLSKRRGVETDSPAELWSGYQHDCAHVVREMSRDYLGFRLEVVRVGLGRRFDYSCRTFTADGDTVAIGVPTWKTPVDRTPPIR